MPDTSEPGSPDKRTRDLTNKGQWMAIITTILLGQWISAPSANAIDPASEQEMRLYEEIGSLNVCRYRAAGTPFDKAAAIAGETIAQTIQGINSGRISKLGGKALSIEELRKGSINLVVLGSIKMCPEDVPLAVRDKVQKTLVAQSNALVKDSLTSDKGKNREQEFNPSAVNPAQLAAAVTVRVETSGPSGSGAVLSRQGEQYHVATACHVISGSTSQEEVRIITADNRSHRADISTTKQHKNSDLCTVSFKSKNRYPTPRIALERSKVGDPVYVAGWSLSNEDIPAALRLIQGVVTASPQGLGQDGYSLVYTTTAPTLPGMSGGPIIIANQLVGIHGRAERAPDVITDGKIMATSYSLGLSIELLEK